MRKQKENAHHIKNPTNNSNNQFVKKQGRPLKEVVPGNYTKYLRENIPITIPVYKNGDERNYNPCAEPFEIPPEWNEEDAQAFNADVNNPPQNQSEETEFSDPMHPEIEKHLPLSLLQYCNFNVKWIRPKDYVKNFYLDKEIKISYPKKNYVKMRIDIKDTYEIFKKAIASGVDNYEYDIDMLLADDEESRKKNIYKYFYRILDRELEIKVVEIKERPETDEEYKKRRDLEIEEKMKQEALIKSSKKMKTNESKKAATPLSRAHANEKSLITKTISAGFTGYHEERLNLILANPTNITVSEAYKDPTKSIIILSTPAKMMNYNFAKWVGSVFQTIIDQNILDAYTDRPIWHNIYPQKDNFPIFSPTGRYMIKLYFMGKPRKIEIDDSIPCNGDDEYILPFCGSIEEIWPALFTKALIKLNRYKTKYPEHVIDEIGDSSIIYNLTGYIGQTVNLEQHSEEDVKFLKSMQDMLSDEIYCEKKKILICYKKHTQLSENQVTNFEKKAEIEESESPIRDVIKNLFSLKKKTTVKSDSTLVKEKLEMSSIRRFDRSSTRKLSYTGGFLKNLINIGVQGLNFKRPSAQSMFNTEKNRKSSVKEGDENIRTSVQPGEPASLTTGNSNLYYDFAYSISDFFDNENFNVKRLNQVDFSDLKKKLKEFQTSCVYKQLNKDDKKKYIYTLIELKNGEKEEKLIRMEELKKEVRKFNLVKIMNESYGNNSLNFYIPYTPEEILMVKTCLLNNWEFPPPSYFDEKYKISNRNHNIPGLSSKTLSSKKDIDSIKNSHKDIKGYRVIKETESGMESLLGLSQEYSLAVNEQKFPKHTVSHSSWNKESYMQLIENNLDQYAYPKEPIVRQNGGVWIHYPEFKTYFNRFIILHNPNKLYTSHISCENFWKNWKQDMFDPNEVNSVFILNQKEKSLFSENKSSSNMLMLFKPNSEKSFLHSEKIKSYIQFKIVDSDNNVVHDKVILKSFFSTFYTDVLTPDKNYFIIIDGGIIPFGYFIQIFSESHSVTSISHSNYLKTYFGFQSINLRIDHPSIEKSKYYILSRFSIKCLNYTSELLNVEFSINYPDKYAKRFFDIICYKNTTTNKHVLNFNEVIKLKQDANIYYVKYSSHLLI